jgi:hypothetical protein
MTTLLIYKAIASKNIITFPEAVNPVFNPMVEKRAQYSPWAKSPGRIPLTDS